jgi:D-alanine-D-alanine ligase
MRATVVPAGARDSVGAPWRGLVRRKGHIDPLLLRLLIGVACVPLLLAFARVLALPGSDVPPVFVAEWLRDLGLVLNQSFSLRWVPPSDRPTVLYLLTLPTGALLVAVARLTLGLRVLGLRAILIAIGFQEIGFLASFGLMAVVIVVIAALRPSMRRMRLPLYARLPVILCVVATIMVSALLLGPWVRSDTVFNVAFFPTIIMAMMAEGIAKTLAEDNVVVAAWRAAWTIVLAIVLAVIGQTRFVAALALQFPEILLTELVAIVLIAEFLDLRLLEAWPARLSRLLSGVRAWYSEKPRVAIVRNRSRAGVIGRLGKAAPREYRKRSVQPLVDALREQGFAVRVLEGDSTLIRELHAFLPPDPRTGAPGGIVLNVATGVQGVGRFCHVPALLEMLGIAYTGPDPLTHARLADRSALLSTLHRARIRVPRFVAVSDANVAGRFAFPLSVRPRCEPDAVSVVVRDDAALETAVRDVLAMHEQDALIEELVEGRDVWAPLLGNETVESLPLLEALDGGDERCPARISDEQSSLVRECAYKAYRALGCRDYARVDVRLTASGEPVVVDVKWADLLRPHGSFSRSAEVAGFMFPELVARIVEEALLRYSLPSSGRTVAGMRDSPPLAERSERLLAAETTVEGST